jgi:hypothetical protein
MTAYVAAHQTTRTQQLAVIDGTASLATRIAQGFDQQLRGPARYRVARQVSAATPRRRVGRETSSSQVNRGELTLSLILDISV